MHLDFYSETRGVLAVIDDNTFTRGLTGDALRLGGATELLGLRSVADALEHFRAVTPRAIICEMDLPDLDALTFTRRLRAGRMAAPRATPVIVMSRRNRAKDVEDARDAGVDEFVARPFTAKTLGAHVRSVLSQRRPFVDTPNYVGPCRRRRTGIDYSGELRRDGDYLRPAVIREALRGSLLTHINSVRLANNTVNRPFRARVQNIEAIAQVILGICGKLEDQPLEKTLRSLLSYFESRQYKDHYDRQIVESHVDVMQSLVLLRGDEAIREAVVEELLRQVRKRKPPTSIVALAC